MCHRRKYVYTLVACCSAMLIVANLVQAQNYIQNTDLIIPDVTSAQIGQSVTDLGDLFDDGSPYIAVGEPEAEGGGAIWIVQLQSDLSYKPGAKAFRFPEDPADLSEFEGLDQGDEFGFSIALLEDIDGNGVQEIAVGSPSYDGNGAVWILYLSNTGTLNQVTKITEFDMLVRFTEPLAFNSFGYAVAGVPGLGEEDETVILISTPTESSSVLPPRVYACAIDKAGVRSCGILTNDDESAGSSLPYFGSAITYLRTLTETEVFLAIGASRFVSAEGARGRVYFYTLQRNGSSLTFTQQGVYDDDRGSHLGESLVSPGDIDGDGCVDLIGGGPQFSTGGFAPGRIHFMYMDCSVINPQVEATFSVQLDPGDNVTQTIRGGTSLAVVHAPGKDAFSLFTGAPRDRRGGVEVSSDEPLGAIHNLTLFDPLPSVALNDQLTIDEDQVHGIGGSFLVNNDRLNGQAPYVIEVGNTFGNGSVSPSLIDESGILFYTPPPDFFGTLELTYRLGDNRFESIFDSPYTFGRLSLTIEPVEDLPRIDSLATLTAPAGALFNEQIRVTEVDGDPISVSVLKAPEWLASAISGDTTNFVVTLVGTPSMDDAGEHEVILFADDGKGSTTRSFIVTVPAEPLAVPLLTTPGNGAIEQPTDVQIAWEAVANATSYTIEWSTDETFTSNVQQLQSSTLTATLPRLNQGTRYFWRVQGSSDLAESPFSAPFSFTTADPTSVSVEGERPATFRLDQNYPNPFTPQTTIRYALAESGPVVIHVYDMLGRHIKNLVNTTQRAGDHQVVFDASHLPNGVYFYQITSGVYTETRRMTLLK